MAPLALTALTALLALGPAAAQDHSGHGTVAPKPATNRTTVDETTKAAILEGIADERRTETVYKAIIEKHSDVRPFINTVRAEARHAALLEALLTSRGLDVPEPSAVAATAPATVGEACAAALESERANVALYDRLLAAGPLPEDVMSAFEHNRRASLEHHIPAFERCMARGGGGRAAASEPRAGGPTGRAGRARGGSCGCGACGHGHRGGCCGVAAGTLSAPAGAGGR
jgi:hypothetical protein